MTILILNWRDIKNPSGGGAEILTHEMAKRWVQAGHKVIHISSAFKTAKLKENIDGIEYIRKGAWWNVHLFACYYYFRYFRKKVDIVIDEVHWFPFFSALYAPKKTVAFVCEVANKLFYTIFPYPLAVCLRFIEKVYLFLYRNIPTMVISQSTEADLLKEGHISRNVIVIPMGINIPEKIKQYPKEKDPTFIYVARLNKQKGIFDVIDAFVLIHKQINHAKLWIVGSGEESIMQQLKEKIAKEKLIKYITFFGFVSEERKFELLSRANLLVSASVQEGWGLTVPEAGLTKTPSIVYDTSGFCDIIENNKNGLLVEHTPSALRDGVISTLNDNKKYQRMQLTIYTKAKQYSWNNTASISLKFLQQCYKK